MKSIVSYPERGQGGSNQYRGNFSPKFAQDLINFFKPAKVFDPMCGSNTTGDVCKALGIEHLTLDLNPKFGGFDALSNEIPESSNLIIFHPPYWDIIKYSGKGKAWGDSPDERDLSRCRSYDEFITKLNRIQAKLITSLRKGGHLAILIGDVKKNGRLYSIQKDMDWYGQPINVVIKAQHNCWSDNRHYSGKFIPIVHEYCLIFKRDDCYVLPLRTVKHINYDLRNSEKITWRDLVLSALSKLGGKASLTELYEEVKQHEKIKTNPHWKEKVRQVLQVYNEFKNTSRAGYELAV